MIKIRFAKVKELDKFYPYFKEQVECFFYPEYTRKTLDYFYKTDSSPEKVLEAIKHKALLVAEEDRNYVGFALQMEGSFGGVVTLNWLMVDKAHQKKGIATKLLKKYEEDAIAKGHHCVLILTEDWNVDFYQNRGYTFMGRNPKGYFGVVDNWFYKTIQEPEEENFLKGGV